MNSEEIKKNNSNSELKEGAGDEEPTTPFKDKVLGTSKLQEETNNKSGTESPKKPEFLRMQSQITLPVVKNE